MSQCTTERSETRLSRDQVRAETAFALSRCVTLEPGGVDQKNLPGQTQPISTSSGLCDHSAWRSNMQKRSVAAMAGLKPGLRPSDA